MKFNKQLPLDGLMSDLLSILIHEFLRFMYDYILYFDKFNKE